MNLKNKLEALKKELEGQKKIYQPSLFWKKNIYKFFSIFQKEGLNKFRSNKLANNYFVPLYHLRREKFSGQFQKIIKKNKSTRLSTEISKLMNGHGHALSDYRTFKAADDTSRLPFLHLFSENNMGKPKEQFKFENKLFSRSSLNYLLGITLIKKIDKKFIIKNVLEIGGGFGILGHILGQSKLKNFKYINVDLPPLSLVTENYLANVFGKNKVTDYFKIKDKSFLNINKLKMFSSFPCWKIENLKGSLDLFVNFISFQEMEPFILKNYVKHIFRLKPKYILLRNLREGKQKKTKFNSVGVKSQIKTNLYLNLFEKKYKLIVKNVLPFGYLTFDGFNSEILIFKKK